MVKSFSLNSAYIIFSEDTAKIKPFLEEFEAVWEMYPDLRFGQLVENLSAEINIDYFMPKKTYG